MCAAAVAKTEMSGREFQWLAGENISWPGPGTARPHDWINTAALQHRNLFLEQFRISACAGRIVTARDIHFNVAEPTLPEMRLESGHGIRRFHVGNEPHIDFRDRFVR